MLTAKMDGCLNLMPTGPTAVGSLSAKQQAQLSAPALLTTRRAREPKEGGKKQPRSQGADDHPERKKGSTDPSHTGEIAKDSKHRDDHTGQKRNPSSNHRDKCAPMGDGFDIHTSSAAGYRFTAHSCNTDEQKSVSSLLDRTAAAFTRRQSTASSRLDSPHGWPKRRNRSRDG